ncbi:MAG: flagellar assembly peptidoglycan hydrolase FlgJ [Candidatus Sedimenticola sp. 1PA]
MNLASASIYTDFQGLGALKAQAVNDEKGSLDEVAKQFEALMMQQMLKAMRQASQGEGLFDSEQSLFYRDMYDQQLAIHLAESGGLGMADVIKRQLGGDESKQELQTKGIEDYPRMGHAASVQIESSNVGRASARYVGLAGAVPINSSAFPPSLEVKPELQQVRSDRAPDTSSWQPVDFVKELLPLAKKAASMLGLEPQALLAQAALETGWGKHMMRFGNGEAANNLFGIKADPSWKGNRVALNTLEYEQGAAVKKRAFFRAYESLADSFMDYAEFLRSNPRYERALSKAGDAEEYFSELQQAGYATDPEYANKINKIMSGDLMKEAFAGLKTDPQEPL